MRALRTLLLAGACSALLVSCGSNDTGGAIGDEGTPVQADVSAALVIDVKADDAALRNGSINCTDAGAHGTGFLIDQALADLACAALDNPDIVRRLVDGPADDRACTEQYGGPEEATVTGIVHGDDVDTTVNRADGCGIADWELLQPLVGPPQA